MGKFPRDPGILERGAEFFERNEEVGRARELLKQVTALDANSPRRLSHLASLDADVGDTAEARQLLELLLARTDPEKPGDPLRPPPELDYAPDALSGLIAGMSSHRARALGLFAPAPVAESDERQLRLDAVRDLSRLLRRWVGGGSPVVDQALARGGCRRSTQRTAGRVFLHGRNRADHGFGGRLVQGIAKR